MLIVRPRHACLAASLLLAACGTKEPTGGDTTAKSGLRPPAAGPAKAADGSGSVTFAITRLWVGNTDREGNPDPAKGWRSLGYDLDGKISTAASTDLCQPRNNAPSAHLYPDGNQGIDNSFGENILPILLGLTSDLQNKVNDSLAEGKWTTLFDLQQLGTGSDYNPLAARVYTGSDLGSMPKFDGSDQWPVTAESLADKSDLQNPLLAFPQGYLAGHVWVSSVGGPLQITVGPVPLKIRNAIVTMQLDSTNATVRQGTIAGVLDTEELANDFRQAAGGLDSSLCQGPTIDSIIAQITQASDILKDGTQDPAKPCDGISIGLGFEASAVRLGSVAAPVAPATPACE